ncbi:hypothetical protein O9929_12595 [Vibrio lentus]|nr:hypothetical protein [Vibrio lentus]
MESAGISAEEMLKDWDSFVEMGKKAKREQRSYIADNASTAMKIVPLRLDEGQSVYFGEDTRS